MTFSPERAAGVRDALRAATEATHGLIARAEAAFSRLCLTAEANVQLEGAGRGCGKLASGSAHLLEWRPVDGRWRLVLETRTGEGLGRSSSCLLTASSRHYRLAALRALPLLHARLEAVSSARAPTSGSSPEGKPRPP